MGNDIRLEERLPSLKNHPIVYFEKFVDEKPRSVRAEPRSVAIFEHPVAIHKLYATLVSRQRVVVEFDVAVAHSANSDDSLVF